MSAAPLVSVVIPTYNQADLLRLALESVVAQTEKRWEAIVINNFSPDHTEAVVRSFDDPRIRLINFANHGVIAASRNVGIRDARAEWVAFLDSDDLWLPDKLETCLRTIDEQTDVLGHALIFIRDGAVVRHHRSGPQWRTSASNLLYHGSCLTPSAALVRRTCLVEVGGFSEDAAMVTAEDYELWIKLAKAGARFRIIDQALTHYRLHAANSSGSVDRHLAASLEVLRRHAPGHSAFMLRRAEARYVYAAGRTLQRAGDHGPALRRYCQSLLRFPLQPKLAAAIPSCLMKKVAAMPEAIRFALALSWVVFVLGAYLFANQAYFINKFSAFLPMLGL